jgi:energy-coupling factor transporter transmembrane protein EcfT
VIADDVDRMDRLAASGTTLVHRASPAARTAAAAITVAAAVVSEDSRALAAIAALLLLEGAIAGVNPARLILRSLAPLPFLAVAFLLHPETPPGRMLLLLLRAGVSATAAALLLSTTTSADVLRAVGPFLPRPIVAALAVLYRSLFVLLRSSSHRLEAARLRGVRGAVGPLVGGLLLEAFERTENVACVLHVRAVDVPDPDRADAFRPRPADVLPLGVAAAALVLSLASRVSA